MFVLSDLLIWPASVRLHLLPRTPQHANDQVLAARDHVPHAYYKYLFESLLGTVRDGIAECSEVRTQNGHSFFSLFLSAPMSYVRVSWLGLMRSFTYVRRRCGVGNR